MRIIIFGATGMIGQGVLRECLRDALITEVVTVTRSRLPRRHPKMRELLLDDLFAIETIQGELKNLDACFYCLGISSVGMSEADYIKTTYDLTMAIAAPLARLNPAMTFVFVSGAGAGRDSRTMWGRVKARAEDGLATLPLKASYVFRPGFIQPLHGILSKTGWYNAIYGAIGPLSAALTRLLPRIATTTERVGRAMIAVAADGYSTRVLDSADINAASAGVRSDQAGPG